MDGLLAIAERYRLRIGPLQVWTPYWINADEAPFWLNAPYRGKATPGQLERTVQGLVADDEPANAEQVRAIMRKHGLGVDCSGFTYYVLDHWLQRTLRRRVAECLYVSRDEILARNARRELMKRRWGNRPVPELMVLAEACHIWQTNPVYWTNVRRLLDRRVVEPVSVVSQIRPGDMIGMTNKRGEDHIALVLKLEDGRIVYGDSASDAAGGVSIRFVKLNDPELGLEHQEWSQRHLFHPGVGGTVDGVWRLKEPA